MCLFKNADKQYYRKNVRRRKNNNKSELIEKMYLKEQEELIIPDATKVSLI